MLIFGIETSCDETSCAIVEDGRRVLANVVASQINIHQEFGGVVPEVAAREHMESINYVIDKTFRQAQILPAQISAFASTIGPGLVGCLLVGMNAAKALSLAYDKPFIAVDHLQSHVCANFIDTRLEPPFLCLLVSGGHTQIIKVESFESQIILAQTIDDAVGEVYDKVARLLGLPYPGGILLDKMGQLGNPDAYKFTEARVPDNEFSFSGLKTASANLIKSFNGVDVPLKDICASFQHNITKTLFNRTIKFAKELNYKTIVLAGGVAANSELRKKFDNFVEENPDFNVLHPEIKYCTDNAAMVASCAYFNPIKAHDTLNLEVYSRA